MTKESSGLSLITLWNLPVSWHVDFGDFEVEVGHSSDRNAITSCSKVEELLLQLQREGQHHVPETPAATQGEL